MQRLASAFDLSRGISASCGVRAEVDVAMKSTLHAGRGGKVAAHNRVKLSDAV